MTGTGTKDDPYIPDGSWDDFLAAIAMVHDPANTWHDCYVKMPPNIEFDLSKIYPDDAGGTRQIEWNCLDFDGNGLVIRNGSFTSSGYPVFWSKNEHDDANRGFTKKYVHNTNFLDIQYINVSGSTKTGGSCLFGQRRTTGDYCSLWMFDHCEFRVNLTGKYAHLVGKVNNGNSNLSARGDHVFNSCNLDITGSGIEYDNWLLSNFEEDGRYSIPKFNNCKIHVDIADPDPKMRTFVANHSAREYICEFYSCYVDSNVGWYACYFDVVNSVLNFRLSEGLEADGLPIVDWDSFNANQYKTVYIHRPTGTIVKNGPMFSTDTANGYHVSYLPAEDLTNPKALHDAGLPIDPGE